jgi:hypothetical protein
VFITVWNGLSSESHAARREIRANAARRGANFIDGIERIGKPQFHEAVRRGRGSAL